MTARLTDIAEDLAETATRIANALPRRLGTMLEQLVGQPGAAGPSDRPSRQWCDEHGRDLRACLDEDLACTGWTVTVSDPTGEAAVTTDRARHDRAQIEHHLGIAWHAVDVIQGILARYPEGKMPKAPATDGVPAGACQSCWRDHHHFEPTATGTYRRWCRWCGDFLADYGEMPPTAILERRHRGQRISTREIDEALQAKPRRRRRSPRVLA